MKANVELFTRTGQTVFTIFCFQKMFKITKFNLVPKCFITGMSVEHYICTSNANCLFWKIIFFPTFQSTCMHFQTPCWIVCQVKLRIHALINILIFTELLILSLTQLHSQYCGSTKIQPRLSPFRPDLSETKWQCCAAYASLAVKNSVYGNIPASFPCVSMGWTVELIVINFAHSELCS